MNRKIIIPAVIVIALFVVYFVVQGGKSSESAEIFVDVEVGLFEMDIETSGELEAKNSVQIMGPSRLRDFRIYNVSIQSIVNEGTTVRQGEVIARLDKSELNNKIQDFQDDLDQKLSQYEQTQLDTALQMRQARDELINLQYNVEEREIVLEQSQFEPPATIKQAEIELEKSKRALTQARENYKIKVQQNRAKMREIAIQLNKRRRELDDIRKLEADFIIRAPEEGMLIYHKGFDGKPIKEGSQISAWSPVVATLPDLSKMISKTYVNEVDIRKIKSGQQVEIGLDAFPDKRLTGRVIRVANVGENRPNSDAKVFQVDVEINESDDLLRPGMTTSNRVIAEVVDSAMYVPLETLHSQFDSITYVYKRSGGGAIKQEVMLGISNANSSVVLAGIEPGDRLYLSKPDGYDDVDVNLIPEMDGKRQQEEEKVVEEPKGRTITLPDGRVITIPADGQGRRPGGGRPAGGAKVESSN